MDEVLAVKFDEDNNAEEEVKINDYVMNITIKRVDSK